MSKIEIDKVAWKNFLSYGNSDHEFEFKPGVHLVLGWDKQKERSNGAGKTSFLETLPFCFFGQVSKGLPQGKIVNWVNGNKCQVTTTFTKDSNEYELYRSIKPGKLKLKRNGQDVPLLSDKRVFQSELENDLLGMDFKSAQMVTFQNANEMISVLKSKKEDKRKFIERFFNLIVFSQANEWVNAKLKGNKDKVEEINYKIGEKRKNIDDLQRELQDFDAVDVATYHNTMVSAKNVYDELTALLPAVAADPDGQLEATERQLQEFRKGLEKYREEIREKDVGIASDTTLKDSLNGRLQQIGDLDEQIIKLDKLRTGLSKIGDINSQAQEVRDSIVIAEAEAEEAREEMFGHCDVVNSLRHKTQALEQGKEHLEKHSTCPTCDRDIDAAFLMERFTKPFEDAKLGWDRERAVQERLQEINAEKWKHVHELKENLKVLEERNAKKILIERKIAELSAVEEKRHEVATVKEQLEDIENRLPDMIGAREQTERLTTNCINFIKEKEDEVSKIRNIIAQAERLNTARLMYEQQLEIAEREKAAQESKIAVRKEILGDIDDMEQKIETFNTMKDHLEYLKDSLKDEHVKQYAISNIIPFLEQRANHYLAETGHSYYLKLDNWLDGEIKGYGVGECDFSNMSGGEGKSIDLALKFAMMDVARRQAGSYMDVLVLDELLDSSIDSYGLEKLMDIIKLKQREDNLKVFVVSHREEMSGVDFDTVYRVVKDEGFSDIEVVE